jgi:hypothetical protein
MRILMFVLVMMMFPAGAAVAHGSGCSGENCRYSASSCDGHDGCGWHSHRRWFRRSHRAHRHHRGHYHKDAHAHGHGHVHAHAHTHHHGHGHHGCCDEYRAAGAPGFPAHPRDGDEVIVDGHQWEWDEDDHRWERD